MMWLLFLHCPLDLECQVCLTNRNLKENPIPWPFFPSFAFKQGNIYTFQLLKSFDVQLKTKKLVMMPTVNTTHNVCLKYICERYRSYNVKSNH